MIFSAIEIELAIVASIAGHGLSYCANLRAASIDAAINSTRLRPSSIAVFYIFAVCSPSEIPVNAEELLDGCIKQAFTIPASK